MVWLGRSYIPCKGECYLAAMRIVSKYRDKGLGRFAFFEHVLVSVLTVVVLFIVLFYVVALEGTSGQEAVDSASAFFWDKSSGMALVLALTLLVVVNTLLYRLRAKPMVVAMEVDARQQCLRLDLRTPMVGKLRQVELPLAAVEWEVYRTSFFPMVPRYRGSVFAVNGKPVGYVFEDQAAWDDQKRALRRFLVTLDDQLQDRTIMTAAGRLR